MVEGERCMNFLARRYGELDFERLTRPTVIPLAACSRVTDRDGPFWFASLAVAVRGLDGPI